MLFVPKNPRVLVRWAERTHDVAENEKPLFANVKTFCLFIGNPRSGHSLVGSLLDAHPRMIVAHQFDALGLMASPTPYTRWQLYHLLLANSRHYAEEGRVQTGYSYDVPDQWQGRFETLEVIGDKSGGVTEKRIRESPELLDELRERVGVPVRFIHIVRNPFDIIGNFATREERPLDEATDLFFMRSRTVADLEGRLEAGAMLHMRQEDLVSDPRGGLRTLCEFLGVAAPEDYLDASAAIVFAKPQRTRDKVEWPDWAVERVSAESADFGFLEGYDLED